MSSSTLFAAPHFPISLKPLTSFINQPVNATLLATMTPRTLEPPFYYTSSPRLVSRVSDTMLSLLVPVAVYWGLSLVFHILDVCQFDYFEKRRIHETPEVLARNKATMWQVFRAVIGQHVLQTAVGIMWLPSEEQALKQYHYVDHIGKMQGMAPRIASLVMLVLGRETGEAVLRTHGEALVRWMYWWGVPLIQYVWGFFVLDTWQYFWHRIFHTSRFLYKHFHSVHHRLYVPYAFGALYNHPLEALIFDALGAGVAQELSFMSMRQAALLFAISEFKTVDDHSGYRLWWDPCQMFFYNNVDYHDIHHQAYGIKANFSQPFFTNWDILLGTRMSRADAERKTRRHVKEE